jgi:DNA-binding NarL/FixJ family response regulator
MRRGNGTSFDGYLNCSLVRIGDASPELRIALTDITDQRMAEAARRRLETRLRQLTRRERDVLVLALEGMPNSEISARLRVNQRTVENHRSRIHKKTGVASLLELAHEAAAARMTLAEIAASIEPSNT